MKTLARRRTNSPTLDQASHVGAQSPLCLASDNGRPAYRRETPGPGLDGSGRRSSQRGLAAHGWSDRPTSSEGRGLSSSWEKLIRLNGPWDWFVTFTFKSDVSIQQAVSKREQWIAKLSQAVRDKSGLRARVTWVCAIEWTHARRVHLHLLLKAPGLDDLSRRRWRTRWECLGSVCGMARIHSACVRAAPYLTKYVGKGGLMDCGGRFVRWRDPRHQRTSSELLAPTGPTVGDKSLLPNSSARPSSLPGAGKKTGVPPLSRGGGGVAMQIWLPGGVGQSSPPSG